MKNLENVSFVSEESYDRISAMALQYKRYAKVNIELIQSDGNTLVLNATQTAPANGKVLSELELVERVEKLFEGEIPGYVTLNIFAKPYE